jgi:hypothetical protein
MFFINLANGNQKNWYLKTVDFGFIDTKNNAVMD